MTNDLDQVLELIAAAVLSMGALLFLLALAEKTLLSSPAPQEVDASPPASPALADAGSPMLP